MQMSFLRRVVGVAELRQHRGKLRVGSGSLPWLKPAASAVPGRAEAVAHAGSLGLSVCSGFMLLQGMT